jgi:4-amino-4-deoxy-L-arabinose transferase-like glycosyltransferase
MNKEKRQFLKLDWFFMSFIILVGLLLRVYNYDSPLADYHSWRQADTASVARNFVKDGINLMEPRYDDLTSIQSGLENVTGLRFVEFPIYNALMAGMFNIAPFFPVEVWGRIISALMSLTVIGVLYYIALKESSRITAIAAASVYAFFPFFVFFSRTVLPENTALGFVFLSIFFLYLFTRTETASKQVILFILSVVFFAMSILVKPTAIFYGLVLAYLFIRKYNIGVFKAFPVYLYFILAAIPLVLWRVYILQFPEGIPFAAWLFTDVQTSEGQKNIFFKPAFFRWIFFERVNNQILGGFMTFFLVLGALAKPRTFLLPVIALSGLVYVFTFQGGNVQHEYYQIMLFPALAVLCGLGFNFIYKNHRQFIHPAVSIVGCIAIIALSWFFSYYKVRDFYAIPTDLVQIARIVQTLTRPEDKIITDRSGDTTLLYLMDRKGAPAIYKDIQVLRGDGYKYIVVTAPETIIAMKEKEQLQTVFENDKFALFRL